MSGETDENVVTDPSIFDLFKSDAALHKQTLGANLAALKNDPENGDFIDSSIEAARTLKGLAALVELDPVMEVARAMCDCLECAREKRIVLASAGIDVLMSAVDLMGRISEIDSEELAGWLDSAREEIDELVSSIDELFAKRANDAESETPPPNLDIPVSDGQPSNIATKKEEPSGRAPNPPGATVSSNASLIDDPVMLEIFKNEIAENSRILNEGLIDLENDPASLEILEPVMRGAHSIKGAARIVGLDPAVGLAHVMEDCFVAAQNREIELGADHIDILLKGVDMLVEISEKACDNTLERWHAENEAFFEELVSAVACIRSGKKIPALKSVPVGEKEVESAGVEEKIEPDGDEKASGAVSAEKTESDGISEKDDRPAAEEKKSVVDIAEKERTVRVTAAKIERLIGLAGEFAVSTQWLPKFATSLMTMKKSFADTLSLLEDLHEETKDGNLEKARGSIREGREKIKKTAAFFAEKVNGLDMFINNSATLSDRLYHEAVGTRMRPFQEGVAMLPRLVRDISRRLGKKAKLEIAGQFTEVDQDILEKLDAPLNHLLRNALDHGIEPPDERIAKGKDETGTLRLQAEHRSGMLMITVSDDGRGIDPEKLKRKIVEKGLATEEMVEKMSNAELMDFMFLPGFSTAGSVTEISGRGVGLDVVHNMVHEVGGVVRATSVPGDGIQFQLQLPLTLSIIRTLLVKIAGEIYAFPLARIDRCLTVAEEQIVKVENSQYFRFENKNISLIDMRQVLEIDDGEVPRDEFFAVVVSDRMDSYALVVDEFLEECELVVRPLDYRLGKVLDIGATSLLIDNSPVLIFDVEDLVRSIDNFLHGKRLREFGPAEENEEEKAAKRILVVDDSITVREMERQILQNRGYQVEVAIDGMDGWHAVRSGNYDMVVTDIDMPRMNGIELIDHIRKHPDLQSLPVVVISYKDKEEDRLAGMEAGANYYLTKSSFQDDSFVEAVKDLIGEG